MLVGYLTRLEKAEKFCGLWLVACGLWLVACGLWLVACGLWANPAQLIFMYKVLPKNIIISSKIKRMNNEE
jgi:hypothetical protein